MSTHAKYHKRPNATVCQAKSVRFNSEVVVLETYSSIDYDRSDIFSSYIPSKRNPHAVVKKPLPRLSLSILPSLAKDNEGEDTISSADANTPSPCETYVPDYVMKKRKRKPSLTVNTTMCSDPLFFTELSTNYKHYDTHLSPKFC